MITEKITQPCEAIYFNLYIRGRNKIEKKTLRNILIVIIMWENAL